MSLVIIMLEGRLMLALNGAPRGPVRDTPVDAIELFPSTTPLASFPCSLAHDGKPY